MLSQPGAPPQTSHTHELDFGRKGPGEERRRGGRKYVGPYQVWTGIDSSLYVCVCVLTAEYHRRARDVSHPKVRKIFFLGQISYKIREFC